MLPEPTVAIVNAPNKMSGRYRLKDWVKIICRFWKKLDVCSLPADSNFWYQPEQRTNSIKHEEILLPNLTFSYRFMIILLKCVLYNWSTFIKEHDQPWLNYRRIFFKYTPARQTNKKFPYLQNQWNCPFFALLFFSPLLLLIYFLFHRKKLSIFIISCIKRCNSYLK